MMSERQEIEELATLAGVLSSYHQGDRAVETPIEAKRAVLDGLGFPVDSAAERARARARLRSLRETPIPRLFACECGSPALLPTRKGVGSSAQWFIELESGEQIEGDERSEDGGLRLPALPDGYHRLSLRNGGGRAQCLVISAPKRCWQPDEMAQGRRGFGLTAQIYGLRSSRQFGIGDYTDVGDLAEGSARWGVSFLGLSPAHALFPADPSRYSPYSPSSRLFLQTLLIDPAAVAENASGSFPDLLARLNLGPRLAELREANLIDYDKAYALKRDLFEALWTAFGDHDREAFDAFRREQGEALDQHATFEALSERFVEQGLASAMDWPEPYRQVGSPEVERFRRENSERIAFFSWLQWIADRQFAAAHARARRAGMSIGLYRDLAVGSDRGGSELWCAPSRYLHKMSIGAPPDPLGPEGQDWGLPPYDPIALEVKELRPFRDLVRANMRHAGAVRIDHAFQLRRLFLIPARAPASLGAYVNYPLEGLLGVLRLESHRAKCLVIGEDLGTAPRGFSDAIMRAGILSYRLLSFEREASGAFTRPRDYPREALAAISTHDLPTLKGWWRGLDIDLRECFGSYDCERAARERRARAGDRRLLIESLESERLPAGQAFRASAPPSHACVRFLARAPSALLAVQIEDAIGETQQANLPGPSTGHPNWRRRLSLDVAAVVAPGGPIARTAASMAREGRAFSDPPPRVASAAPRATYRLQLNHGFGFDEAAVIIPYLRDLGVSHVYVSPITKATPGSMHGYDVQDYLEINPELGGLAGFLRFSDALRLNGLGLVVDFVPNHMGVAGSGNDWWNSVLEWGERSPNAIVFDIDFHSRACPGKVLLPTLGKPLGEALEGGDIRLDLDADAGEFFFSYFDQRFPVAPDCYPKLLDAARAGAEATGSIFDEVATQFERLAAEPSRNLPQAALEAKKLLARALAQNPAFRRALIAVLKGFDPGSQRGRQALDRLLARQHYRLAFWRQAASELNYRRFFDISTLAGVRAEDAEVFSRMHRLLFDFARQNRIQGIRLDHIDGLADPAAYLEALQQEIGPGFYVIVEKILERGEKLREWPIAGSTGYDMLAELDQVFVASEHAAEFDAFHLAAIGDDAGYEDQLACIKSSLLSQSFGAELSGVVRAFGELSAARRPSLDLDEDSLRSALIALIASFPVYRTYISAHGPDDQDRRVLDEAVASARERLAGHLHRALDFVIESLASTAPDEAHRRAATKLQQLSGPLMAKSLEDTLFYRYGRLIALNEVGGDPSRFGETLDEFHASMTERARAWPATLNATSTHDVKRGEDARARLLAATGSPELWREAWATFRRFLPTIGPGPDAIDTYMLFQSILASAPLELIGRPRQEAARAAYEERAKQFAIKAIREAKRQTSWTDPDPVYESAVLRAIERLLSRESGFLDQFAPIARECARLGSQLSLARVLLKCALPGIPDFYQGAEFWDLSFVDPDNRRPVDYTARENGLETIQASEDFAPDWWDPRAKQVIIARMLADRMQDPDLYALGGYRPMAVTNGDANYLAFERRLRDDRLVVLAAIRFGPHERAARKRAELELEVGSWRNLLDGATLQSKGSLAVEKILGSWPAIALRTLR